MWLNFSLNNFYVDRHNLLRTISRRNATYFVPNCKSGYRGSTEKCSLFGASKSEKNFLRWQGNILRTDRKLSMRDVVCEKHFLKVGVVIRRCKYNDTTYVNSFICN